MYCFSIIPPSLSNLTKNCDLLSSGVDVKYFMVKSFSKVKDTQKSEKNYRLFENYYETFLSQIKDCPKAPPKYKWNSNDVCLNAKDCFQTIRLLWSSIIKKGECKCKGKYDYKCDSDYCASNKQACNHLKQMVRSKIKKC